MPIIWVYGNHYDIWEHPTSIAYASENLKRFVDLSRIVVVRLFFSTAEKKIP